MLDTVRNKVLDLALELHAEIGSLEGTPATLPAERIDRAFTAIVLGNNNVITGAISGDLQIGSRTVIKGNFASLAPVLAEIGVPDEEASALAVAVADDHAAGNETGIGPRTTAWLQKALGYVGKGTAKVAGDVATAVLTRAVLSYLGISG